ncbi:MAG: MFS transporter [Hamadaea sp.]|nr:MFS transporter [Hamadaea sp.]
MRTSALRIPAFRRLWAAVTVSSLGAWLLVIAVPVQIYRLTGSVTATGLALAVESLPGMLLAPWAGVAVDRWDRRRTAALAHVAAAAGVATMLLAGSGRVWPIYLGVLAESIAVAFLVPALRALTPALVGTGPELASANALTAFSHSTFRVLGPVIGTLLTARGWFTAVVVADALAGLLAAALVVTVRAVPAPAPTGSPSVLADLREGLRRLTRTPALRGLLATSTVFLTANAALTALLVPFCAAHLGDPDRTAGRLIAGLGVGYLCGSALSKPLLLRYAQRTILIWAYAAVGACFLVLFTASTLVVALGAITLCGVPGAVILVTVGHAVQTVTPGPLLGRVSAAFFSADATAAVAGGLLGPAAAAVAGLDRAVVGFSAAVLLAAAVAALTLPRLPFTPALSARS